MKRFGLFCAAMCAVAALATACGGSGNTTYEGNTGTATATASGSGTTSAPASASAATITISDMSFGAPITVPPGAQISIKNDDAAEHTVTSDTAGKFDVEVDGMGQKTFTAPTEPGDYAFHCKYHSSMHGSLTVK